MQHILITLLILLFSSPVISASDPEPFSWGKYGSEEGYTAAVNEELRRSYDQKIISAKKQGKKDWLIVVSATIIFLVPTFLSLLKKNTLKITILFFFLLTPMMLLLWTIFLGMQGGGDSLGWGAMKHPVLYSYFSEIDLFPYIKKIIIYFIPIYSFTLYSFLFFDGTIKKEYIISSLSFYLIMCLVGIAVAFVIGNLA